MRRARKAPRQFRLLDWNIGASRPMADVEQHLRQLAVEARWPQVITLHEAWRYDAAIRAALGAKYVMHEEIGGGFKADDNIILTRRKDSLAGRLAFLRMRLRWTGPKSPKKNNQPPRIWPVLDIGWRKWRIVSFHNVTANPASNEKARAEAMYALVELAEERGSQRRGLIVVGDFNGPPKPLAQAIDGHSVEGYRVDHAVVRGATGRRLRIFDRHGSDHPPVLYIFTRD